MAVCVEAVGTALNVSPVAIGSCTDYVLYTSAEYAALSPQLTPSEVAELSMSVVSVWAVVWAIKILRRAL